MIETDVKHFEVIPEELAERKRVAARAPYRRKLARRISQLYLEGYPVSEICKMKDMPNERTFYRWMREKGEFRELINGARESRAVRYEDKAIQAAEQVDNKEDVPAARLKFDAYKWAAEVNDPSRYGKKTTISGDASAPIKFIISTGFPEPSLAQQHPKLGSDGLIIPEALDIEVTEPPNED